MRSLPSLRPRHVRKPILEHALTIDSLVKCSIARRCTPRNYSVRNNLFNIFITKYNRKRSVYLDSLCPSIQRFLPVRAVVRCTCTHRNLKAQ